MIVTRLPVIVSKVFAVFIGSGFSPDMTNVTILAKAAALVMRIWTTVDRCGTPGNFRGNLSEGFVYWVTKLKVEFHGFHCLLVLAE